MDERDESQTDKGDVEAAKTEDRDPDGELQVDEPIDGDVEPVEEEIESLNAELEDLRDRHLRLAAEFDNFRKRTLKERATLSERAQAELVKQLLEPLDDLSRVTEVDPDAKEAESLVEGIQLVEQKMRRALTELGLEPIEAVGHKFDPELHAALTLTPTEDPSEDEIVSQELTRGYLFKGKLLRPSLVEVKKHTEADEEKADEEAEDES